jgi:hypothetical protein
MRQRNRFGSPALIIAIIALFIALGGTVYAAKQIDGKSIKVKSIPGNRLKPRTVTAKQLSLGILLGAEKPGAITGAQINESTLGQVPNAIHADTADTARSATDALTALNAVNAVTAEKINGHSAGCLPGTMPFAGDCWQSSASAFPESAPAAAVSCALKGGTLPGTLELAAFAKLSGVTLDAGGEWTSDIPVFSGKDTYGVAIVLPDGAVDSKISTGPLKYRCVIPLVS